MSARERGELEKVIFEEFTITGKQEIIEPKVEEPAKFKQKFNPRFLQQIKDQKVSYAEESKQSADIPLYFKQTSSMSAKHDTDFKSSLLAKLEKRLLEESNPSSR